MAQIRKAKEEIILCNNLNIYHNGKTNFHQSVSKGC